MMLEVVSMSKDMLVAFVRNVCKWGGSGGQRLWPPRTVIEFAFLHDNWGNASIVECCTGVCSGPGLGPLPFHGVNCKIEVKWHRCHADKVVDSFLTRKPVQGWFHPWTMQLSLHWLCAGLDQRIGRQLVAEAKSHGCDMMRDITTSPFDIPHHWGT